MTGNIKTIAPPSTMELLGSTHATIIAAITLIILILFVVGITQRIQRKGSFIYGWWLRNISIWLIIFGGVCFTLYWTTTWVNIYVAPAQPKDVSWNYWHIESYFRLTAYVFIALIAWTFSMVMGPTQIKTMPTIKR